MKKYLILILLLFIISCSKKHQPQLSAVKSQVLTSRSVKIRGPLPKTLTMDDRAATKSVDGRLYFDLEGHRYWKNYKDGKYYKYNKSMYNNPEFQLSASQKTN